MLKKILTFVAMPLAAIGFGLLLLAEKKRPLRQATVNKLKRVPRNLALGGVTALAVNLLFVPVVSAVARRVQKRKLGLLNRLPLPAPLQFIAALMLLDYTFYWWHRWLHENGFLWRFHIVHHADLDLDVSTAARFHFGEYLLSTPYRAAQIILIGASPVAAATFELMFMLAAEFHHGNVRLPLDVERRLNTFMVTPRMHGIHHSIIADESNANYATILTVWDWLHRTLRLNVPQDEITIGLAAYRDESELMLSKLLTMPFVVQRDAWQFIDGARPVRGALPAPDTELMA
jgi:sterol desaturase/sphingolipid hydroxylase (fatty acid hydroxylase superfamily)